MGIGFALYPCLRIVDVALVLQVYLCLPFASEHRLRHLDVCTVSTHAQNTEMSRKRKRDPATMLGEGTYGKVFEQEGRAVKISTPVETIDDLVPIARELFVIRKGIPGCVPYCSSHFECPSMHMVMEKATSNLKHAQIDPRRAAIQLLQTLYRMHHLKIMHRDLKTSNVLVLGDQLWVCDFGLSRQFCNECGEDGSEYVFTSWYRAPEVFRKEGYTDKADMWSLGCLLHKIVHGDVPGTDLDEIVRYVPSLSGTGEMNVLIKNLLRMNPVERWSAETALAFLKQPCIPCNDTFAARTRVRSKRRTKWFKVFRAAFPDEHRVLAHGLMLFDKSKQEKSMCGAMAVAAMLFKTDPFEMIDFAEYQFSSQAMSFQEFISGYIPLVCDGELSEWERSDVDFDTYIKNNLKLCCC